MEWMQPLLVFLAAVITAMLAWFGVRGSNKNKDKEVETERARSSLAANAEWTKYVREQVNEAVAAATAGLREEIAGLRRELVQMRERDRDMKAIVRRYFQRLFWWNERGRVGDMPMPSESDMHLLELSDIEMTSPPADLLALRKPHVPPIPGRKETE